MSDIPSEGHAYCRACTDVGDTPLWRYSANDYQLDADCTYSSVAECEKQNNPRQNYIDPSECLVFFNDDGLDWMKGGVNLFDGAYGETNKQIPIPSTVMGTLKPQEGSMSFSYRNPPNQPSAPFRMVEDLTLPESRLWAYDVVENIAYYLDSFPIAGPDIAMSHSKLFMGCTYGVQDWKSGIEEGCLSPDTVNPSYSVFDWAYAPTYSTCGSSLYKPATVSVNSYTYKMTLNDTTTWSKSPHKSYRFVTDTGDFITKGAQGLPSASPTKRGTPNLGMGLASISDTELILDDGMGNIYYADLNNYWTGTTATTYDWFSDHFKVAEEWYAIEPSAYIYQTSNAVDVQGNPYFDLSLTGYKQDERKPSDAWYSCSNEMGNHVYTIECKKIIDAAAFSEDDLIFDSNGKVLNHPLGGSAGAGSFGGIAGFLQGDISFNATDPILSGDPSVTITYREAGLANFNQSSSAQLELEEGGCPQIPGTPQNLGDGCSWKIAKYKFPKDLNNITVQYQSDRFTDNAAVTDDSNTPFATRALIKDISNSKLYGVSQRHRFNIDATTLKFTSPVQIKVRLYDEQGVGSLTTWDSGINAWAGTTNQSGMNWVTGGHSESADFLGGAQSPSCTDDNYTYNCTINGCISVYGLGGDFSTMALCEDDCISYSCVTACYCPSGATSNLLNGWEARVFQATQKPGDIYEYKQDSNVSAQNVDTDDSCAWKVPYVFNSAWDNSSLVFASDGFQNSQWGSDGTRFCLNNDCSSYHDLAGPSSGQDSGFWGQSGNYLNNARLNSIGAWPGAITWGGGLSPDASSTWYYAGQVVPPSTFTYPVNGLYQRKWAGISRCVTVTGSSTQLYLIGIASADYYRVGVDGVSVINTMQRELSEIKGFNPTLFPSYPTTAVEHVNMTVQNPTNERWWVHRIELTPGTHSITLEGTSGWAQGDKILGCDIIGPFDVSEYTTAADVATITPQIYTANTIFSTEDLNEVQQIFAPGQTSSGCFLHNSTGPCPYPLGGQLMYQYPDQYAINWGLGGVTGWVGGGTSTVINLGNGGVLSDWGVGVIRWNVKILPYMAPKINGVPVFHAGTGQDVTTIKFDLMPMVTELPTTVGLSSFYPWSAYNQPADPDEGPCESDIPSMVSGGVTYMKRAGGYSIKGIIPNVPIGNFNAIQNWRDLIDWLNAQGLYVSSVPDPGTTNYPNIDYNATYFQVTYAMSDYWTPIFPNGAPNGGHPGGQSTHTFGGGEGTYIGNTCYSWCNCLKTTGIFDTMETSCDRLNSENYYHYNLGSSAGGYNSVTGSLAAGSGLPCGSDCGRDWIYDSCYGSCVSTTGCTDQSNHVNFTGGCTPIDGTGYTQTDVFNTLVDCEDNCSTSGSTGGTIYYLCGDSGCTTASTVTPFTSLAQCTGSCISYNCTTTGCTEFNPPASTANIGESPDYYGTGGTYSNQSACWTSCVSWDCTNWGCEQYGLSAYLGSGGSYTTELACTADCRSWECLSHGCVDYVGSGYTFSSQTLCTNVCRSYECTLDCCELYNVPFYGTGGTYYDQASSGASAALCTGDCSSWGCNSQVVASGTNIYTFYDTDSTTLDSIKMGILHMSAWTSSLYGFTGNSYSIINGDERWLSWASSVYTGLHTGGTATPAQNQVAGFIHQWAVDAGIDGTIYDNCAAGASFAPLLSSAGNVILGKGPAPVSTAADDVLVIGLLNESTKPGSPPAGFLYHSPISVLGTTMVEYPQYSGGNATFANEYQPSDTWKEDYDGFNYYHSQMLVGGGSFQGFVFATYPSDPNDPPYISQKQRVFPLQVVASIDLGNKPTQNGTWYSGTSPRMSNAGGLVGGSPDLCSIANLFALELPENPYYQEGYGSLSTKGWGYNVNYSNPTFQSTATLQDSLTIFLSSGITSTTGCISACTIPTTFYPYSSQTECFSGKTSCPYYNCTDTGCQLTSPFGTLGTYSTLLDCENECLSWECNNFTATSISTGVGACSVQPGTGGTFTNDIDCANLCNSYQCYGTSILGAPSGCLSNLGTGNTFNSYSACTADCRSWECDACSGTTSSGDCIEYPYTGMTYSSQTACTASCVTEWWCVPEITLDACSGRTIIFQVTSQPPANSSLGPFGNGSIGDIIANQINGHQFTNLSQIKYLDKYLTDLYGPNGTIFPNHPAYAGICMEPWGWCSLGGTCDYFVMHPVRIESDLVPGGPWYVYSDFIDAAQNAGVIMPNGSLISLNDLWPEVKDAIATFYNAPQSGTHTRVITDKCICSSDDCHIECSTIGIPPGPTWTGPYPSSGDAYSVCCASTWECTEGYSIDSCSGRTNVAVGMQFNSPVEAFNAVAAAFPGHNINTLSYESDVSPATLTEPCVGPMGGALMKYDPYDYTLLNNGISYSTWDYFIHDLQQQGLTQVSSGMSYDLVSFYLHEFSGNSLSICTSPCRCLEVECSCYEIDGSGGTYTTEISCLTALTAGVASCICPEVTGTSWNCYSDGPFEPTCQKKVDMGVVANEHTVVDWHRVNAPAQLFDANKFVNTHHILGGTLTQTPVPTLTQAQVTANMWSTSYSWYDCYTMMSTTPLSFLPYNHLMSIQHQYLIGGNGQYNSNMGVWEYSNWNDFYSAGVAAGAPLTTSMSFSSVCETLTLFLNPSSLNFECGIRVENCCSSDDCYCLPQYDTGGTYTTENLCVTACCETYSGYTCEPLIGCLAAPSSASPYWSGPTALADCQACILNPLCSSGQTCQDITWNCESGSTAGASGPTLGPVSLGGTVGGPPLYAPGTGPSNPDHCEGWVTTAQWMGGYIDYIDLISPGYHWGQPNPTGVPFLTTPPTYPFTSNTVTEGGGMAGLTGWKSLGRFHIWSR